MTDDPPRPTEPSAPTSRRGTWLLALAAVVAIAVVVLALTGSGGDDEEDPPLVTSDLPAPAGTTTDPDTLELLELLEAGRGETYHASYTTTGETDAGATTLEVWRRGSELRQDSITTVEGDEVRTSSFVRADEVIVCAQVGEEDWSCSSSPRSEGDDESGVFGSVADQLAGSGVEARDSDVGGVEARCFTYSGPAGDGELCVDDRGIPLSVESDGILIERVDLDGEIADATFDPPVDPAQLDAGS